MTTPYISITESDIEEAIKDTLDLGRFIEGQNGDYWDTMGILHALGLTRESFRNAALAGICARLSVEGQFGLRKKILEWVGKAT